MPCLITTGYHHGHVSLGHAQAPRLLLWWLLRPSLHQGPRYPGNSRPGKSSRDRQNEGSAEVSVVNHWWIRSIVNQWANHHLGVGQKRPTAKSPSISGWWFGGHFWHFPHSYWELLIIPIDELIFFRGVAQPPAPNHHPFIGGLSINHPFWCHLQWQATHPMAAPAPRGAAGPSLAASVAVAGAMGSTAAAAARAMAASPRAWGKYVVNICWMNG